MQPQFQSSPDSSQLAVIQRKLYLDGRIRSGVNWFFWIAGFSLINTIVYLFGGQLTFVVGLGITQIIDGVMSVIARDFGTNGMIFRVIGFAIDVAIAAVFVAFGILGRKQIRIAIIIGTVLYALDGVILLLFKDFLGAAFHGLALFGIINSLRSISELANLEKNVNVESIESLKQRMPFLQSQAAPQPRSNRLTLVLIGLVFLIAISTIVIISLQR